MIYTPRARLTFRAILPVTIAVVPIARLRLPLFFARRWLPNARRRVSLPVLVSLIRFAVPLWVFNFGIIYSLLRRSDYDQPFVASVLELRLPQEGLVSVSPARILALCAPSRVLGRISVCEPCGQP